MSQAARLKMDDNIIMTLGTKLYSQPIWWILVKELIQNAIDAGGCRFCDYGVLRKPNDPLKGHDEDCPYLAARAYLDNETSTVVKRDLSDFEIEELGAQEAEKRGEI